MQVNNYYPYFPQIRPDRMSGTGSRWRGCETEEPGGDIEHSTCVVVLGSVGGRGQSVFLV